MEKQKTPQNFLGRMALFATALLLLLFLAGCPCQLTPTPIKPNVTILNSTNTTVIVHPSACADPDCLILAANDCADSNLTITEDVGVFKYSSSNGCVFTKTLVSLNSNETADMKKLLEGKSLTCKYEKGKFDSRLVTSLIFGTENCEGNLKDALGELLAFT